MDVVRPGLYRVLGQIASHLETPEHIAFVMDGNRRFARQRQQKPSSGHQAGYSALRQILEFCFSCGVKEVSVYAFSIENFKRPEEEVSDLMRIADERIKQIIDNNDLAVKHGVRVRIIGDKTLLPKSLQNTVNEAEDLTKTHTNVRLNICMPYTSRDDIAHVMRVYDPDVPFDSQLYTAGARPLDLLIRTSGTNRLSDYFLWEITDSTVVQFVDTLWPEFTPWTMFKCLLWYANERKQALWREM